jgi:hypothetical protein
MKVYRGPSSKPFYDDTHELVSLVSPQQLEEGIRSKALIRFNITKDGYERQAVCTAQFEDVDIVPMIDGLVSRLKMSQAALAAIRNAMEDEGLPQAEKLGAVATALATLK